MDLQLKINENTILHYIENSQDHIFKDKVIIDSYQLSFSFYDCHYYVGVSRKDIDDDFPSVCMDGDSKLFDSFESLCEGELWETIKSKCNDFDKWYEDFLNN